MRGLQSPLSSVGKSLTVTKDHRPWVGREGYTYLPSLTNSQTGAKTKGGRKLLSFMGRGRLWLPKVSPWLRTIQTPNNRSLDALEGSSYPWALGRIHIASPLKFLSPERN